MKVSASVILQAMLMSTVTAAAGLPDTTKITNWLDANGFVGLVVTVLLFFVFLMGTCMMLNVQTPIAFPAKSIDWGRVEEHE